MSIKKFTFVFLLILFACAPILTKAVTPGKIPTAKELGVQDSPIDTAGGLLDIVASVVKWVYTLFFIIAILFIIIAAFNFLTGGDQPEKIKSAKNQLIYAAIAIAIALLSFATLNIIANFLEGKDTGENQQNNFPETISV
ncbi:hypothetical protein JW698_01205 [Candidatus Wolfebacteria bacterium]|nr:hypothetical protein [Candidatus Wolfebacteria bacterium]